MYFLVPNESEANSRDHLQPAEELSTRVSAAVVIQ